MSVITALYSYVICVIIFFIIDMIWLGAVAKNFYAEQLGDLMTDNIRWGVAVIFYLLYVVGIVIFAVRPGIIDNSVVTAALWGAAFGFFCYATYDLTNLATTRGWPTKMVFVDIVWGTILTASVAGLGTWVTLMIRTP